VLKKGNICGNTKSLDKTFKSQQTQILNMDLTLGITLALITALFWAIADIISKNLMNNKISKWTVLFIAEFIGSIILFLIVVFTNKLENFLTLPILFVIGLAVLNFIAMSLFFKSVELNKLSIASPIIYSSVVVTVLLSVIFYRETLNLIQIISIAVIIIGIIMVIYKSDNKNKINYQILIPIVAMILFGVYYFLIKLTIQYFNPINITWIINFITSLLCIPLAIKYGRKLPNLKTFSFSALFGILNIFGFLAFNIAITLAPVSIIATIKSLAPVFGIILAAILFRERLSKREGFGVVLAIVGMILLSVLS